MIIVCTGPTVNGNLHAPARAMWLDNSNMIDDDKHYYGWYCPVCHKILGEKGER